MNMREKGFTLVEMAIVLLIMGLVVGSIFSFLSVQRDQDEKKITINRQEKIATALASYAQGQGAIPCPADQNVFNDNVNYGVAPASCSGTNLKGIVPFRTLGLTLEDIVDGYGHPFSYVVSASAVSTDVPNLVHQNCRTSAWFASPGGVTNLNRNKARFCCQAANSGLQINVYNNTQKETSTLVTRTQTALSTANVDAQSTPNTDITAYFAYVLISHGPKGSGYFILPSKTERFANAKGPDSSAGTAEKENAMNNAGMDFITLPRQDALDPPDVHFDDIVFWRTQQAVISEFNNDSCARP